MDYIFVSSMLSDLVTKKLITYDIACQWSVHLVDRINAFPPHLQIELPEDDIAYGIPKLHFDSHKKIDHSKFSLNYKPGAARTDGEGIERRWWFVQPIAAATVGMGPGRRQSVLEDQWAYSNWRKYVRMRECHTFLAYVSRFNTHFSLDIKEAPCKRPLGVCRPRINIQRAHRLHQFRYNLEMEDHGGGLGEGYVPR